MMLVKPLKKCHQKLSVLSALLMLSVIWLAMILFKMPKTWRSHLKINVRKSKDKNRSFDEPSNKLKHKIKEHPVTLLKTF